MPEVPKIVHERLRAAGAREGAHPDANLLAALAEQTLSATEREDVLQHLAGCADCREMVALSIPALESVPELVPEAAGPAARVSLPRRRMWFAWNRLGWAGLAAGVLIAVGVLVMQPVKRETIHEAQQKPAATLVPPVGRTDASQTASRLSSEVATTAENRPEALAPEAPRRNEMKKLAAPVAAPKETVSPAQATAQRKGANLERSFDKDLQAGQAGGVSAPRPGSAKERVEVSAGTAITTESAQTVDVLAETEAAPVMRAKAAPALDAPAAATKTADAKQEEGRASRQQRSTAYMAGAQPQMAGANAMEVLKKSSMPSQWAIHGDEVQRSIDSGARWTTVFHHRALLCVAAFGTDVWAGGKGGDLFHSADSGATWTQIRASLAGQTLGDDVARIDVYSPNQVVLSTSKDESWRTVDGGKTWTKK